MKKIEVTLYHMNGCYHCEIFKPQWKKFRELMEKKCKNIDINEYENDEVEKRTDIGKINGESVNGYPTLVVTLIEGKRKKDYDLWDHYKNRNADDLVNFMKLLEKKFNGDE